jgi:hypothetical protein
LEKCQNTPVFALEKCQNKTVIPRSSRILFKKQMRKFQIVLSLEFKDGFNIDNYKQVFGINNCLQNIEKIKSKLKIENVTNSYEAFT